MFMPKKGDLVTVRDTGWEIKVESVREENGYTFITLEGRSALYELKDIQPIPNKTFSAVNIKHQYSNMVLMMEQRQKALQEKKMELEDELNDIEYEENLLEDAIRALSELK